MKLTPRETEVVELIAKGLVDKQIAYRLGICLRTVKEHKAHARAKFGAKTTAQLIMLLARSL